MKGESICHGRSTGAACQLKDFSEWWLQKPRRHHRPTSGKLYAISKLKRRIYGLVASPTGSHRLHECDDLPCGLLNADN